MDGGKRRGRVLALLATEGPGVDQLCAACVGYLPGVTGASVAVLTNPATRHTVHATDQLGERLEDLQFTLGEGPCVDAFAEGGPVLAVDLSEPQYLLRWPVFVPAGVTAGARAVFAFPLQVGAIRIGVLDLYRVTPGALPDTELADALVFADALTWLLLGNGHNGAVVDRLDPVAGGRAVVHQATGMLRVQLGVSIDEALVRLRTHAYANDQPVEQVAREVVARRLRFEDMDD